MQASLEMYLTGYYPFKYMQSYNYRPFQPEIDTKKKPYVYKQVI